jgi:HD-like signal output (HDOD) protein/CheY-like chemotaxis protein
MQRILFVDDEPRLLDALSRMLRPRRHEWDMTFVVGGEAGIAALDAESFDVLVTDMRMPVVDGVAVLRHARERSPRTVRIALSGQTELAVMTRSVSLVHQFLAKPCDPVVLRSVIERVCALQSLLNDPLLQHVVGQLGELPVLPRTYARFAAALEDPETSIKSIIRIVEQDVALAARCLQLANSAYFGLRRPVDTLEQAVTYLGIGMLRDLVLSTAAFSSFKPGRQLTNEGLARLERHSVVVANVARAILDHHELGQQAFMAGMLHDIGVLVLATCGSSASGVLADHEICGWTDADPERQASDVDADGAVRNATVGRVTHAEVGAYLLGLWGLPHAIVEAVAFHHQPARARPDRFDVLGAVYTANQLVHEIESSDGSSEPSGAAELGTFLENVGLTQRLPELREIAGELTSAARE